MTVVVEVRGYDPSTDLATVEEVERRCEVGPTGKLSLFTDLLGDPICRVRHSPSYLMLVITQTQILPKTKLLLIMMNKLTKEIKLFTFLPHVGTYSKLQKFYHFFLN